MEFTYFGGNCILITTKQLKVLVDPLEKMPKQKSDVTLLTEQSEADFSHQEVFNIASPGEYEIKRVSIHGVPARLHVDKPQDPRKGVMYVIEYRGVHALITGNIAPTLSDQQLEAIGTIDVLVVPVGGHGLTLDSNAASGIVSQLEPSYVIPVHYDDGKTTYAMPQDKIDVFLKEMGSESVQPVSKFKVSDKEASEGTSVVVLSRQS